MKMMLMCPHEFNVALCDVTVNNAALSLSLVGHRVLDDIILKALLQDGYLLYKIC